MSDELWITELAPRVETAWVAVWLSILSLAIDLPLSATVFLAFTRHGAIAVALVGNDDYFQRVGCTIGLAICPLVSLLVAFRVVHVWFAALHKVVYERRPSGQLVTRRSTPAERRHVATMGRMINRPMLTYQLLAIGAYNTSLVISFTRADTTEQAAWFRDHMLSAAVPGITNFLLGVIIGAVSKVRAERRAANSVP